MSVPDPAGESPVADSPDTPAPRLALVVIARNEARAIERSLSSAGPWVDEMVVLDTGSTDHTVALARACGARVHHFAWVDDFSAARNAALAHTDAQWTLVLDADEWIEDGADCLSRNRLGDGAFIGVASIRGTFESGGARTSATSSISRLLPRGTRYRGRIHEQPQSNLPRRKIPLVIGHDGYMPDMLEKKRDRNAALLARELADDPESAYVHFHLGKDHEVYERYAQACDHYRRAWERSTPGDGFRHGLITRWMHCMGRIGMTHEAIDLGCAQIDQWQRSPDFFFVTGNLVLDLAVAHPERAHAQLLPWRRTAGSAAWRSARRPGSKTASPGAAASWPRTTSPSCEAAWDTGRAPRNLRRSVCGPSAWPPGWDRNPTSRPRLARPRGQGVDPKSSGCESASRSR